MSCMDELSHGTEVHDAILVYGITSDPRAEGQHSKHFCTALLYPCGFFSLGTVFATSLVMSSSARTNIPTSRSPMRSTAREQCVCTPVPFMYRRHRDQFLISNP